MNFTEKNLDRKFLAFLYKDSVNDIADLFENFIAVTPEAIVRINILLNNNYLLKASRQINRLTADLNAIGLPCLAVKLQIVAVYIDFSKLSTAKTLFKQFESELKEYMPAVIHEYSRQSAYKHFIKIQPVRTIAI